MRRRRLVQGIGAWLVGWTMCAPAVVFYSTGDPGHNTNAPTGSLTDSGWNYEGFYGDYVGTPISSRHFITAEHFGSYSTFTYEGQTCHITETHANPTNDLVICTVAETFSSWAPIYTNNTESGGAALLLGRGRERGSNVTVNSTLKGWMYGYDPLSYGDPLNTKILRWGTNTVSGFANDGQWIEMLFNGSDDKAALGPGDSGGGLFIKDPADSVWKLAGINYAISGSYSTDSGGANPFEASLFDSSGLYIGSGSTWKNASGPSASVATRISTNTDWIYSVIPEPSTGMFMLMALASAIVTRRLRGR